MKWIIIQPVRVTLLALALMLMGVTPIWAASAVKGELAPGRAMAQQATKARNLWITADHTKFEALQGPFDEGNQISKACLSCHSEAGAQFRKTIHWSWIGTGPEDPKRLGKGGDSLNNFCISTNNMQDKKCTTCHPGWDGKKAEVNCLACHGQKEINWSESFADYRAFTGSADPEERELATDIQADIRSAAQSVGRPTRKNCGACHFYGGGGNGVKHGDLDSSITLPSKALDVHMGTDGQNFQCTRCHTTVLHNVAGRIYSKPAVTERKSLIEDDLTPKITCESCHSSTPHKSGSKANDHTDRVACQSCHIPQMARELPTKMWWDWSKAGKLKDGKKYNVKGNLDRDVYMSIKGDMKWAKNVQPEYFWFNGSMNTLTVRDTIEPSRVVSVSQPMGSREDHRSRIFPFKVHRGKQPYDTIRKTMLAPMLSGPDGYWETLDWQRALSVGQKALNLPFSGQFDFVETRYAFPTTHMVAPKENVVACTECHTGNGSRLASLTGFYMPGRDGAGIIDSLGWLMVLGSLAGVCLHGLGRFFTNGNGRAK